MPNLSRRAIAAWLVAATVSSAVAACGGDEADSTAPSTSAQARQATPPAGLADAGALRVCSDVSYPPMEYYEGSDTSKPLGFDIDAAKAVAERWGVEAQIVNTAFDGLLPALQAGRCDVVWSSIAITPERTAQFPAVPYYQTSTVLLVADGNPEGVHAPEDLAGKTLVVESGTAVYLQLAKQINADLRDAGQAPARIQTYPKATDAIQQLVVGRAAAVITQVTEAAYRMKQQPGAFAIGYTFDDPETAGIYHARDAQELGTALEQALTALRSDGTLAAIATRYELPVDGLDAIRG